MILQNSRKAIDMANLGYMTILLMPFALIQQALCMLACWDEDPNGDCFKKHLARVKEYIWVGEDGIKMHVSTHVLQTNCGTSYIFVEHLIMTLYL